MSAGADAAPTRHDGRLHVYVHVPFCARRCPYCHFYNIGHDDGRESFFLDALEREIDRWRRAGMFEGARLATLYFGGGTPSVLTPAGFGRIAELCRTIAPAAEALEWTVEANPDDASIERFAAWRERGVTRVSIGVQSFDPARLDFLGRIHSGERAVEATLLAAEAGFDDLSIDLMFNLEVEGRKPAWAADLETAFSLPVSHLSLYGLTIEPGTAFAARADSGARLTVPDAAYAAEFRMACRAARAAGFEHYEVSSFALPGHRSRHNSAYWTGAPYLGLGPSAHSYDGRRRWANASSLTAWAEALSTGADPRAFVETLGPTERGLETLYLGLRTAEGVGGDHPLLAAGDARAVVDALLTDSLLRETGDGRLACSERGFLVLDSILDRLATFVDDPPPTAPAPVGGFDNLQGGRYRFMDS
ncbi:MAG: radical SAM family heme chaperone HemW [Gemmatimonadetes bacterium]|nr:radical SAM family heme chaperone HemW [Gemmatimonadota bacterium]